MNKSESITKIAPALAKSWAEIENPKHNKSVSVKLKSGGQYKFEYTDLNGIFDEAKRVFKENEIIIMQDAYTENVEGKLIISVYTMLLHSSGEWLQSNPLRMNANTSIQDMGGQITYLKRYSLSAMLGVATEKDDDANGASGNEYQMSSKEPQRRKSTNSSSDPENITQQQVGSIKTKSMQFAKVRGQTVDAVNQALKITDVTKLNKEQASAIITKLDNWLVKAQEEQQGA